MPTLLMKGGKIYDKRNYEIVRRSPTAKNKYLSPTVVFTYLILLLYEENMSEI